MSQARSKEVCKALHANGRAHEVVATRIIMDAKALSERAIAEVKASLSKQMLGASQRSQGTLVPISQRQVRL
jgi:hypothetical protein